MKILLVTDVWQPQVHGLVSTLVDLVRQLQVNGHDVVVIQPGQFRTRPCPGLPGLKLAWLPGTRMRSLIDAAQPDAIHIATEGPLGWAARRHCLRRNLPFTTAYHGRFPELLQAAFKLPLSWGYELLRRFHRPSSGVLVPNEGLLKRLEARGFHLLRLWTPGVDTHLFALSDRQRSLAALGPLAQPVSLYVGRLSAEKNVEAFLALDVPGSKVVCGEGPMASGLRARYPNVHWMGELPRHELAQVYAAADVFVFPSRGETQGQAMLEAMACGVPVAAHPVDGPLQLVGQNIGGALHDDLRVAWHDALKVQRHQARDRALLSGLGRSSAVFLSHLVVLPRHRRLRPRSGFGVRVNEAGGITKLSHKRHSVVE